MKIIYNDLIPVKGFKAINLFGILFVRNECRDKMREEDYNHEAIHTAQMKELIYIGFYILYVIEWLYRLVFHTSTAYRGISFECEAYDHQNDLSYLENRASYAQWK